MSRVAVVTDSTATFPAGLDTTAARVVPLQVLAGESTWTDGEAVSYTHLTLPTKRIV